MAVNKFYSFLYSQQITTRVPVNFREDNNPVQSETERKCVNHSNHWF